MNIYKVVNLANLRWYITSSDAEISVLSDHDVSITLIDETELEGRVNSWIAYYKLVEDSKTYNITGPCAALHTLPQELQEDLTKSVSANWAGYEELVIEEINQKRRDAWAIKSDEELLIHAERTKKRHTGVNKTEEHKEKIGLANSDPSEDTRRKMSESHKGRVHTSTTIEKLKKIAQERNTPKCSDVEIAEIRKLKKSGISAKTLSSQFGVSENTIYRYCRN